MQRIAVCLLMAVVLAGCGNPNAEQLGKAPEIPTWDGLKALQDQEVMQPIQMNLSMGNIAGMKEHAASEKFQTAFGKFEAEAIPGKFATPEREAARTDVIKHYKALIEGAKAGASDADLKASATAADEAFKKLTTMPPAAAPAK